MEDHFKVKTQFPLERLGLTRNRGNNDKVPHTAMQSRRWQNTELILAMYYSKNQILFREDSLYLKIKFAS